MFGNSPRLTAALMIGVACGLAIFVGVMFADADEILSSLSTRNITPGIAALGLLTPTVGALVMAMSDVVLAINSGRLFVKKVT